jgi:hypothetical protein
MNVSSCSLAASCGIHLMVEGPLERFPELKICASHGGGSLPRSSARRILGCDLSRPRRSDTAVTGADLPPHQVA